MKILSIMLVLVLAVLWPGFLPAQELATVPERSSYLETSRLAEVNALLGKLAANSPLMRLTTMGKSPAGRKIPLMVVGKPLPDAPLKRLGRQRVVIYVQANIHAGEVAGKEAVQILLRRIVKEGFLAPALEKVVLLVAPVFNCDGNEKISKRNRPWQNGPTGGVGVRYNGQGLDLNRDGIKVESPEVQGLLAQVVLPWDPDITIDCHTTNGSCHQHALLAETPHLESMNPVLRQYGRDDFLPALFARIKGERGMQFLPYGFFRDRRNPALGWATFQPLPRYLTNYFGARGRLAVLSEAYVHKDFKTRIDATFALVVGVIREAAARRAELLALMNAVDRKTSRGPAPGEALGVEIAVKSRPQPVTVLGQAEKRVKDPATGRFRWSPLGQPTAWKIPFWGDHAPRRHVPLPAGWLLPPTAGPALALLRRHGLEPVRIKAQRSLDVEGFMITGLTRRARPYQGHRLIQLAGTYKRLSLPLPAGTWYLSARTPLRWLAAWLLEPESLDGMTTWGFFDQGLEKGTLHPVLRVMQGLGETDGRKEKGE